MQSYKLVVHLIVAIVLVFVFALRLNQQGVWHPPVLHKSGIWEVTEMPLTQDDLFFMGEPWALGLYFKNAFDEIVFCRFVSVDSPEAFNPPKVLFTDYDITGSKVIDLAENVQAYGQLYKLKGSEDRVVMVSWLQERSGRAYLDGIDYESQKKFISRVRLGSAALTGRLRQAVIVRVYTIIPNADRLAKQPWRNVLEVSKDVHKQLREMR